MKTAERAAVGHRHHHLHGDVGARRRSTGRSISARASPTPTARPTCVARRRRRAARRPQPVSADDRRARAAPGGRRARTAASTASRSIPAREVVVTSGATEAITACLMALLDPGDEVVLIEPLYDTYLPVVRMLGAVPRLVRLHAAALGAAARRTRRRVRPAHQGDPAQHADEPDRQGVHRGRTRPSSPTCCSSTTPTRSATRSTST